MTYSQTPSTENTFTTSTTFNPTIKDAIKYAKDNLGRKLEKRKDNKAPNVLLDRYGKNPSVEYLFGRMWGIDEDLPVRMVPTDNNKWCLYWKPSLIKKDK